MWKTIKEWIIIIILIIIIIIDLPNQDKIRTLAENETYKYLGILKANTNKQVEMKNKIPKLLEIKLSSISLIQGINTWVVLLVRYAGPFLKWTRDELRQMDKRTKNLMTMHKALHPRDDVDRLYVPRKHYWKRPEYWKEFWRLEKTCCLSISIEKPQLTLMWKPLMSK